MKGRRRRGGRQTKDHKVKVQAIRRDARLDCPRCEEPDCVCEVEQIDTRG
jgi:transcription elongation factor Elf1